MLKNVPNYITFSRILISIIMIFTVPFSIQFLITYIYCGLSDMLDGYIARKSKNTSKFGSMIDSIADIIFVIATIIKIVSFINLPQEIIIWITIIAFVRICNLIYAYRYYKKIILLHTIANKITGLLLFIMPLIFIKNTYILFEIIVCFIATFSAVQEGYYIRTKKYDYICVN